MKLFTKEVDKQLFAQYPKGSDLDNQMVVAKIFNPYGRGVWYLLNSDPEDPDYIWAIVDLFEPDMGSVSRSELQTVKVPPFGLGLERDIYFTPKPAKEVWEGIMKGERFAHGGMTVGRYYKDNSGNELRYIGESEGKMLFKDGEKIVTKSHEDFEDEPKEFKLFGIFADGGETTDEYARGGEVTPYIVWVSKDGEKRELYGEFKSMRAADMKMKKLWETGEYKSMGNKSKSSYEKEGFYADGGETAAAEHNIKQARYGGKLVGKQKNLDVNKNGKLDAEDFKMLRKGKMAMGGKVKFEDKVKAIKASLLKRKKVSPKVQKDYGKTYSPKEALDSARRIVGAQTAKYELKKK